MSVIFSELRVAMILWRWSFLILTRQEVIFWGASCEYTQDIRSSCGLLIFFYHGRGNNIRSCCLKIKKSGGLELGLHVLVTTLTHKQHGCRVATSAFPEHVLGSPPYRWSDTSWDAMASCSATCASGLKNQTSVESQVAYLCSIPDCC